MNWAGHFAPDKVSDAAYSGVARPGFTCTADITTATRTTVTSVPIPAVAVRELTFDTAGQVVKPPKDTKKRKPTDPPPPVLRQAAGTDLRARARAVADYIAGMTDRFAQDEYKRLCAPKEE